MSQALALNTSSWSSLRPKTGQSASAAASAPRGVNVISAQNNWAGGPAIPLGCYVPGVALGLTPPSAIRERDRKKNEFLGAMEAGINLAVEMAASDEIDPSDFEVWETAFLKLSPYIGLVSAPLVHPLQLGGVSFEWHEAGLNIELRFRDHQDIFLVVEDARGEIPEFLGKDNDLTKAAPAFNALIRRQA